MKHLAVTIAFLAAACGGKKDEPAPKTKEPEAAAEKKPAPPAPPPAAPAPVDPATFVDVDLSSVKVLATVAAKAPPGATVTADRLGFNETDPEGAVIEAGGFALRLWWSTTGGERTVRPMMAEMQNSGVYTETKHDPSLVEYTIDAAGTKTYGFFLPVDGFERGELSDSHGQLLCGPAKEVASPEALAPYRTACAAVKKKKKT